MDRFGASHGDHMTHSGTPCLTVSIGRLVVTAKQTFSEQEVVVAILQIDMWTFGSLIKLSIIKYSDVFALTKPPVPVHIRT